MDPAGIHGRSADTHRKRGGQNGAIAFVPDRHHHGQGCGSLAPFRQQVRKRHLDGALRRVDIGQDESRVVQRLTFKVEEVARHGPATGFPTRGSAQTHVGTAIAVQDLTRGVSYLS